jgi:penicillin-binding protein 1C
MNADTAARLTYILADRDLRRRAFGERNFLDFPFEVAAKTGTSKDHIDSWTVGFTENYAVGVWLGNFSGQGMYGVSGNWGAGRVFHQVMRLVADPNHRFDYPDNWRGVELCRDSGRPVATNPGCRSYVELAAPGDLQRWGGAFSVSFASVDSSDSVFSPREDGEKPHNSTRGTQGLMRSGIISPAPGERFIYDETLAIEQKIPLRISTADLVGELSYRINDGPKRAIQSDVDRGLRLGNGSHKVTLYQGSEVIDRVWFFVEGGR